MSIELMLNAVNINLVAFSRYCDTHATGQVFAIFILTVAAAEAAVGLGIVSIDLPQRIYSRHGKVQFLEVVEFIDSCRAEAIVAD